MLEVNLENHKGGWCPYSKQSLFCQEGMCEGCLVWPLVERREEEMTIRFESVDELKRNTSPEFVAKNAAQLGLVASIEQVYGNAAPKQNKYHVAAREDRFYAGKLYASKKEALKAQELDLRVKAGDIKGYLIQVPFRLPGGTSHRLDFAILNLDNTVTWLEVKGRDLPMGKLKRKQVEELYHITIKVE
jgi:hypothetical protein